MGKRLFRISADLLLDICKGLGEGPPRCFQVVADPIPADARIVGVCQSHYWPDVVEVTLESEAWETRTDEPCPELRPLMTTVEVP